MAFDNAISTLKEVVSSNDTEETSCKSAEQEAHRTVDRRNVLKGISAASGAVALGSSAVAADEGSTVPEKRAMSEEKRDEILGPYTKVGKMREALIPNVAPLLRELAKSGYTDTANPSRLGLDELQQLTSESTEGITAGVVAKKEIEDPSRLIKASIEHKSRRFRFWVNPDGEIATALVYDGSGEVIKELRVHNSSAGSSPVIEDGESSDCDDSTQTQASGSAGSASFTASSGSVGSASFTTGDNHGPTGCDQPGDYNWYCGTYNDCEGIQEGYCNWGCYCGYTGGCWGNYTLHAIKEVYDEEEGEWQDAVIACPNGDYCYTTGCQNLDCQRGCQCGTECTNNDCALC